MIFAGVSLACQQQIHGKEGDQETPTRRVPKDKIIVLSFRPWKCTIKQRCHFVHESIKFPRSLLLNH